MAGRTCGTTSRDLGEGTIICSRSSISALLTPNSSRRANYLPGIWGRSGQLLPLVDLKDDLSASLLQARLLEFNLPINVAVGTLS
jgi:hypothetical protein